MKALIINQFGGPEQLQLAEVSLPAAKSSEVLVRIHAAGVNPVDYKIRNGSLKFITGKKFPRILGADFAGVVEQAGKHSSYRPGDKVYGMLTFTGGAYAEFLAVDEKQLTRIPEGFSMSEAAATPLAALTAYQALLKGVRIQDGIRVLVNGASGGVGSFAVQIAKAMGAHVTGVCSKTNVQYVASLGADQVIDYQVDDFLATSETYDLIFDVVAKSGFKKCKKILSKDGTYVSTIPNNMLFLHQALNFFRSKKAWFIATKASGNDLSIISDYIAKGLVRVHVEKSFPLEEASKAHELIETERVRGKLVLTVIEP